MAGIGVLLSNIEWNRMGCAGCSVVDLFIILVNSETMSTSISAVKLSNKPMYFENFLFGNDFEFGENMQE